MRNFLCGVILGTLLTATAGLAGNLYDRNGQPAAPRGSVQQYDYFRSRQQQLDTQALRKNSDQKAYKQAPCEK